ncbi:MAG TPA: methyltransferase domain-containing protein [Propionibacterium sp.]|jgi:ubiquinone/menaquinone biosynthesis C-methylase UbiE|nr:methyltransferase domain-containing protein [Propionibacterium sp.]
MSTHRYMHGHHASVLRAHGWRTAANSAGYLLPHLTAEMTLLDIGAGPGTITADLATRVDRVIATEIDDVTLATTRAGVSASNVEFCIADVHALSLPDGHVDVAHAHQVLQHVTDPVQALREMRRVVRPGGLIAVRDVDYRTMSIHPLSDELAQWLELYRTLARADGGDPDAGPKLLAWAHAAGCTDVTPSASVWCFATPDDRAYWGGTWADRILHSRFADRARDHGVDQATLTAMSHAWKAWADDPDGWIMMTHGEILVHV